MASILEYRVRWWATALTIVVAAAGPWLAAMGGLGGIEWLTARLTHRHAAWWLEAVLDVLGVAGVFVWWANRGDTHAPHGGPQPANTVTR
jgi:hypothetical protein